MQLEDIIKLTGGCGRYQVLLALIVHFMKCTVCFTMLFMVYGGAKPDWWCIEGTEVENATYTAEIPQYKSCSIVNSTERCKNFYFDESTMTTVISKWSLVCDREWISSTITSIQMAGVLIGNLVCGQVADVIGRKPPLFLSLLTLVLFNILAAFSTSWVMFAVIRFILGLAMGFELTVQYNIMSEFTLARWRTWVVAVPSWATEIALFAFVAWLLKDWQHLHFATAAVGLPMLLTYWFVPESFRWYVSHDRLEDAEAVIKKVAKVNGAPVPDMTALHSFKDDMVREKLSDKKYTILDIVKDRTLLKYSLLFVILWFTLGVGGYGIQFGVPALSGDLYINVFLLGLIGSPLQFVLIYLSNRFGRKKTAVLFYIISAVTALIVAVAYRFEETKLQQIVTNISAIISLIAFNAAWSPVQTITIETYPTVVRNIGYGFQNTMARVGAVVGPQMVYLETKFAGIMYWMCGIAAVASIFIILPIPETRNANLQDKLNIIEAPNAEPEEVIELRKDIDTD